VVTIYGHGSTIALVVFLALFALRMLSSARRRGRSRSSAPARSFADTTSTDQASGFAGGSSGQDAFTGIAPGWLIDPTRRHEKRYWSGSEWTEHVSDGGVPGTDPPPPPPPPATGRDTPS
jgi:Protein of unknown function (DUF2510)